MQHNLTKRPLPLRWCLLVLLAVLSACSGASPDASSATTRADSASTTTTTPSTTTSAPTTTTTVATTTTSTTTTIVEYAVADLAVSVAFVDSCVTAGGTSGACQCALGAAAELVPADQWAVFEDRLVADQGLPDALATAMDACRGAEAPLIGDLVPVRLEAACAGVGASGDARVCAVDLAQTVVPTPLLEEWAAAVGDEVEPSMADLVARCT